MTFNNQLVVYVVGIICMTVLIFSAFSVGMNKEIEKERINYNLRLAEIHAQESVLLEMARQSGGVAQACVAEKACRSLAYDILSDAGRFEVLDDLKQWRD